MKSVKIAPSILAADFANLASELHRLTEAGADMVHIDVMDGHFVPNITIGPSVIKALRRSCDLPFDVHLMIQNPDKYIADFANAGADIITVHYEACSDPIATCKAIKALGCQVGISLMPFTEASILRNLYDYLDLILIMTVNPGFGGQVFMQHQLSKITETARMIGSRNIMLEVDGGINDITAHSTIAAGANVLVSGSYLFGAKDMKESIRKLRF